MRRATRRKNPYPSLVKEYRRLFVKAATDAFDSASEGSSWGKIFDASIDSEREVLHLAAHLAALSEGARDHADSRLLAEMINVLLLAYINLSNE